MCDYNESLSNENKYTRQVCLLGTWLCIAANLTFKKLK